MQLSQLAKRDWLDHRARGFDNPLHEQSIRPYIHALLASICLVSGLGAQEPWRFILPEQRSLQIRAPGQLARASIPPSPPPATVADPQWDAKPNYLSLSDVLNISLQNMDVVRVLTGVAASTTGRTVYDTAITNAGVDAARGVFDPALNVSNNWSKTTRPRPSGSHRSGSVANRRHAHDRHLLNVGLSKRLVTGGVIDFGVLGATIASPDW